MPTPDFPDFQRPVVNALRATLLATIAAVKNGTSSTQILDVSQYSALEIFSNGANTETDVSLVNVQWLSDTGSVLDEDTISCNSGNAPVNGGSLYATLPCKGTQVRVFVTRNGGTANVSYLVVGNTRQGMDRRVNANEISHGRLLFDVENQALGAGGTYGPVAFGPVTRAVAIVSETANSAFRIDLAAYAVYAAIPGFSNRISVQTTGSRFTVEDIVIPDAALTVTLTNTSGALANATIRIWDVS